MSLNATDKKFLEEMIPRHEASIKAAGKVISEGEDDWVKQIAINVADKCLCEKRFMESILRENYKEMKDEAIKYCKSMTNMDSWKVFQKSREDGPLKTK